MVQHEREFDIVHGRADRDRAVEQDFDFHVAGILAVSRGKLRLMASTVLMTLHRPVS